MSILTAQEFKELSLKRVELARTTKRDAFATFAINVGGQKAVSNINADPLSKPDRDKINKVKERLTYQEDDADPFF